ncbi:MAG: hypothetical protein L7T26_11860, partial [Pseudomonadales bacterium]|nr:hypothetical protein [Pseudomonadales bacterium]
MLKSPSYLLVILVQIGCGRNPAENAGEVAVSVNNLPTVSVTQDPFHLSGDTAVAASVNFSDADGDAVTLTVSGQDAAKFSVTEKGQV